MAVIPAAIMGRSDYIVKLGAGCWVPGTGFWVLGRTPNTEYNINLIAEAKVQAKVKSL